MFDRDFLMIAFTGADVSGKSTILPIAKQRAEDFGYSALVHFESASAIMSMGFSPSEPWVDPLDFQRALFSHQDFMERLLLQTHKKRLNSKKCVVFLDRGIPDMRPYCGEEGYIRILEENNLQVEEVFARYAAVIKLTTAADGAPDVFLKRWQDNPVRVKRTIAEAIALDKATEKAWSGHNRFAVVDNSTDFPSKIRRTLSFIGRTLGMPDPLEKERRFAVLNFEVPDGTTPIEILQDYLVSDYPSTERRVRRRTLDHVHSYYYGIKHATSEPGVRVEPREPLITLDQYEEYLRTERDVTGTQIEKTRRTFVYEGQTFEHNTYHTCIPGWCLVEAEVDDMERKINFPPGIIYVEVTGDRRCSDWGIAHGLFPHDEIMTKLEAVTSRTA